MNLDWVLSVHIRNNHQNYVDERVISTIRYHVFSFVGVPRFVWSRCSLSDGPRVVTRSLVNNWCAKPGVLHGPRCSERLRKVNQGMLWLVASLFLVRPGATSRVLAPFVAMPFVTSSEEGEPNEQTNNITYRLQGHFITPHVFGPSVVPHRFHVRTWRQGEDFFFSASAYSIPNLYTRPSWIPDHPAWVSWLDTLLHNTCWSPGTCKCCGWMATTWHGHL